MLLWFTSYILTKKFDEKLCPSFELSDPKQTSEIEGQKFLLIFLGVSPKTVAEFHLLITGIFDRKEDYNSHYSPFCFVITLSALNMNYFRAYYCLFLLLYVK